MNKKQLYESIMRTVSREVKKALNENMEGTKEVYFDIECTPFDEYAGKYNRNEIFGYTVKVSRIPVNYDAKKLISNKLKPTYMNPLFAYLADHKLCFEINWDDDRYKARILTDDEVQNVENDEYWLEDVITLNFDDIMNYYSELS